MVYLYEDHGNLQAKEQCPQQSLMMQLPKHGAYVLVLLHPVCEVAVRRFIYWVFYTKMPVCSVSISAFDSEFTSCLVTEDNPSPATSTMIALLRSTSCASNFWTGHEADSVGWLFYRSCTKFRDHNRLVLWNWWHCLCCSWFYPVSASIFWTPLICNRNDLFNLFFCQRQEHYGFVNTVQNSGRIIFFNMFITSFLSLQLPLPYWNIQFSIWLCI